MGCGFCVFEPTPNAVSAKKRGWLETTVPLALSHHNLPSYKQHLLILHLNCSFPYLLKGWGFCGDISTFLCYIWWLHCSKLVSSCTFSPPFWLKGACWVIKNHPTKRYPVLQRAFGDTVLKITPRLAAMPWCAGWCFVPLDCLASQWPPNGVTYPSGSGDTRDSL